jgi:ubiquitin carboxyl-terminal hydrolase 22/27/51
MNGHKGTSTKINCSVDFPAVLDMSPFLTHRIGAITSSPRKRKQGEQLPHSESFANAEVYELFCVICHTGRMDSGHYIAYVRQRNQWYKCDDATITKVSLRTVLDSKG